MNNQKILSALVGLTGAVSNNGKTPQTDALVRRALQSEDSEEMLREIHREKFTISPGCETCPHPCGNTSDLPEERWAAVPEEVRPVREQVIEELRKLAQRGEGELPECVYRAIAYLGYDLSRESYEGLLEEMKK